MLREEYKRQGIFAFLDEVDLIPGSNARASLCKARQDSKLGVAVLSSGFYESGDCMEEAEEFLKRDCLLPICLGLTPDECKVESIFRRSGQAWLKCNMDEARWRAIVEQLRPSQC